MHVVEVLSFPELLCKQITAPWVEAGMIHFLGVCCFSLSLLKVVVFFFCWFLSLWRLQDWTCIYEVMIDGSFSKGKDMIETEATTRQPIEAWRPGTNLRAPCGLFGSLSQRDWWPMAETSIAEDTWLNAVDRRIQECRSVCWFEFTILVASIYYLCQETTWSLFLFWLFTERWSLACNFQCLHQQWFQLVSVTKTGFNFAPST